MNTRLHGPVVYGALLLALAVGFLLGWQLHGTGGETATAATTAGSVPVSAPDSPDTAAPARHHAHDPVYLDEMARIVSDPKFAPAFADIAAHEGYRANLYRDAEGNRTIGIGLCVEPGKCPISR